MDEGVICAACHARLAASLAAPAGRAGLGRATLFGVAGAAVAVALYFLISAAAGRDVGITLVVAGLIVGRSVRMGAPRQRGRRYQWLAVALTYLAIATTYVPFVMKGFIAPAPSSLGATGMNVAELTALAVVAPLIESTGHVLNGIVLAGALILAWRTNSRAAVRISGPYRVRATTA